MAKLATFLFGTKKMPQSHALSKFLYYSQTLPTPVSLQGPEGQAREVEAVIDTGYSGFLTLPPALAAELGLSFVGNGHAYLANDAEVEFDVYDVTVLWDGQPRDIEADMTGSTPLVGMLLLDKHNLNIDVESGGRVLIQAKA